MRGLGLSLLGQHGANLGQNDDNTDDGDDTGGQEDAVDTGLDGISSNTGSGGNAVDSGVDSCCDGSGQGVCEVDHGGADAHILGLQNALSSGSEGDAAEGLSNAGDGNHHEVNDFYIVNQLPYKQYRNFEQYRNHQLVHKNHHLLDHNHLQNQAYQVHRS